MAQGIEYSGGFIHLPDGRRFNVAALDRIEDSFEHDWSLDGWSPFIQVPITADGQVFTRTVANGAGVVTASAAPLGNTRTADLHQGTAGWVDQEVTTLILPPPNGWHTTDVQQGHLHRVRQRSAGQWEGVAVWTSVVFGGDFSYLHAKPVRWDGTTLLQGTTVGDADPGAGDSSFIDRTLTITSKERYTFAAAWLNSFAVQPSHLYGMAVGDIVTVDSSDATFDATDDVVAAANPANGVVQFNEPTTTSVSALAFDRGTLTPSSTSKMKRWAPFWMSTRVTGSNIEIKRWRPEEQEPSWSAPRVVRKEMATNANVPTIPAGPGMAGHWNAHYHTGSAGAWGTSRFRRYS